MSCVYILSGENKVADFSRMEKSLIVIKVCQHSFSVGTIASRKCYVRLQPYAQH